MPQEQIILTAIMLPVLGVVELCILFWPKRPRSEPPPLPRKRPGLPDIPSWWWRPSIMLIIAVIGVFFYVHALTRLEPDGLNPFTLESARVRRMILRPFHYETLIDSDVELTRDEIEVVCRALQSATRIYPNHPGTDWACRLTVVDNAGTVVTVDLHETGGPPEGFLVYWWGPNMGLNKGQYTCDALAPVIEEIVQSRNAEPEK